LGRVPTSVKISKKPYFGVTQSTFGFRAWFILRSIQSYPSDTTSYTWNQG
jgi:hypothetical protein